MKGSTALLLVVAVVAAAAVTYVVVSARRSPQVASIRARPSTGLVPFAPEAVGGGVIYENTEDLQLIRGEDGRIERVIRKITVTRNE